MTRATRGWGVVTLQMGSPTTPEEVEPFLEALFSDPAILTVPLGPLRPLLARLISRRRAPKARQKYGLIGGSPLAAETRAQVVALAAALEPDGLPVRLAMTYTEPRADVAVAELRQAGARRILALPLFPQRSETTTGAALRELTRAADAQGLPVQELPPYPTLPGLVEPLAEAIRGAVSEAGGHATGATAGRELAVLLTAHGLPERHVAAGDPYVGQVEQTAEAIRRAADVGCPVRLAYQSRLGPVRWVGPQVDEVVTELAASGVRTLIVAPITFVTEHLETRYDLDLELRAHAWDRGIQRYLRLPTIGTSPAFIAGLADLIRARLR